MGGKGPLKKLILFFKQVKCYVKIIGNFYKCIIFYLLDIVKYMLLFLPILFFSIVTKTSVLRNTEKVNHFLRWDIKTLNMCYLCKKKKMSKKLNLWKRIQVGIFGNNSTRNVSSHAFFYLLFGIAFVALVVVSFGSGFYHLVSYTEKQAPNIKAAAVAPNIIAEPPAVLNRDGL